MRIGVVAKRGNDRAAELAVRLHAAVDGVADVAVDGSAADAVGVPATPVGEMAGFPLVVSIGGDGTFLYTARHVGETPILGVNLGEVGFLVSVPPSDVIPVVRAELDRVERAGSPRTRSLPRLRARGGGVDLPTALNEVVVHGDHRGRSGGVDLDIHVDGSRYAGVDADGVIVSTATGSTAYTLSERGPIMHPAVDGLVVTPMAPAERTPPIVVPGDASVRVEATGSDRVLVASDGSARTWVDAPATVTVERSAEATIVAGPRPDFARSLRKLGGADHLGPATPEPQDDGTGGDVGERYT